MRSTMISGVAIISILVMLSPHALAVEYVPGVAKGQFAEYSISYESEMPDEGAVDVRPYWYRLQVVGVSGIEVTVQLLAKTKDGSAVEGSGGYFVLDVENGAVDGWQSSSGPLEVYPRFLLMAKNVFYSSLPDQKLFETGMQDVYFEKNEIRNYLGASRNVNVFKGVEYGSYLEGNETAQWRVDYTITETIVFDTISGALMEATYESRENSPDPALNLRIRTTLMDTDFFQPLTDGSVTPTLSVTFSPNPYSEQSGVALLYVALAAGIVAVGGVAVLIYKRKK